MVSSMIQVWICVAVAAALIGPILWIVQSLSYYYKVADVNGLPYHEGMAKLKNCIWYCYGALLQQGKKYNLKNIYTFRYFRSIDYIIACISFCNDLLS